MDGQPLATHGTLQSSPGFPIRFLIRDYHQAEDLYELMDKSYVCGCNEPHVANFGLHRPSKKLHCFSNSKTYKWRFDIFFPSMDIEPLQPFELLQQCVSNPDTEMSESAVTDDIFDER